MLRSITLRNESNTLIKILHLSDCLLVALLLHASAIHFKVVWNLHYSWLALSAFVGSCIVFHSTKLYRPWRGGTFYKELLVIFRSWAIIVFCVLGTLYVTDLFDIFSRQTLLLWFVTTPVAVFAVHLVCRSGLRAIRKRGFNLRRAVIIGTSAQGLYFAKHLEQMPWTGIRLIGYFDNDRQPGDLIDRELPVLGDVDGAVEYLKRDPVDYICIALSMREEELIRSLINRVRTLGAEVLIIPDLMSYAVFNAEVQFWGDVVLINFNPERKDKRVFDILFSLVVLTLSAPLIPFIALLIKLESRGSVFYGHKRITAGGRQFTCWKFRTMCKDADVRLNEMLANDPQTRQEWETYFKLKEDPRITRIGRYLRKTSLDELPQFYNVLKGEMSVVGARPIVQKELSDYYKDHAGLYCSIKPGITGPWQVEQRSDIGNYHERVQMDSSYILENSLLLDFKIIAKTLWCVLKGKGAY